MEGSVSLRKSTALLTEAIQQDQSESSPIAQMTWGGGAWETSRYAGSNRGSWRCISSSHVGKARSWFDAAVAAVCCPKVRYGLRKEMLEGNPTVLQVPMRDWRCKVASFQWYKITAGFAQDRRMPWECSPLPKPEERHFGILPVKIVPQHVCLLP